MPKFPLAAAAIERSLEAVDSREDRQAAQERAATAVEDLPAEIARLVTGQAGRSPHGPQSSKSLANSPPSPHERNRGGDRWDRRQKRCRAECGSNWVVPGSISSSPRSTAVACF